MELALQIVVILMVEFASQMKLALQIMVILSLLVELAGEMELAGQTMVTLTAKTVVT